MTVQTTPITLDDLTTATVEGSGVFDVLMRANKAHLEQEFKLNRIKGTDYSTVYLGSLQAVLSAAMQFTLSREKQNLDALLQAKQIEITELTKVKLQAEIDQTYAQTTLIEQQVINAEDELTTSAKQREKINQDILALQDSLLTTAVQRTQITKETDNVVAQKAQIEAQTTLVSQQKINLAAEASNIPKQGTLLDKQAGQVEQETLNLISTKAKIDADAALITQQKVNLISEELGIDARTALTTQQKDNAAIENTVLVAQECKLRAEYDSILANNLRVASEKALLDQKLTTEKAQTTTGFVDGDSVLGKQKALYEAQAVGYKRDAEQKAAEIMFKSWATRKTTDDATTVNSVNKLEDQYIGTAITKLLEGIGG